MLRESSLIKGRGATKRKGGGGDKTSFSLQKGVGGVGVEKGVEKALAMLNVGGNTTHFG